VVGKFEVSVRGVVRPCYKIHIFISKDYPHAKSSKDSMSYCALPSFYRWNNYNIASSGTSELEDHCIVGNGSPNL
jgi:hypothetical protein